MSDLHDHLVEQNDDAGLKLYAAMTKYCANRIRTAEAKVTTLEKALTESVTAIDDWLNTYAAEMCDEARVKEARDRIQQYGTIGYIAHIQEANRKALEQGDAQ